MQRSSLIRLAFWGAALFTLVMALLPHPPHLPGDPSDKIQHVMAFATLAGLGATAYPRSLLALALGLVVFGASIEVLQSIPILHRDSSILDWFADIVAEVVVIFLIRATRRRRAQSIR